MWLTRVWTLLGYPAKRFFFLINTIEIRRPSNLHKEMEALNNILIHEKKKKTKHGLTFCNMPNIIAVLDVRIVLSNHLLNHHVTVGDQSFNLQALSQQKIQTSAETFWFHMIGVSHFITLLIINYTCKRMWNTTELLQSCVNCGSHNDNV